LKLGCASEEASSAPKHAQHFGYSSFTSDIVAISYWHGVQAQERKIHKVGLNRSLALQLLGFLGGTILQEWAANGARKIQQQTQQRRTRKQAQGMLQQQQTSPAAVVSSL
jgi:hypothetical protein